MCIGYCTLYFIYERSEERGFLVVGRGGNSFLDLGGDVGLIFCLILNAPASCDSPRQTPIWIVSLLALCFGQRIYMYLSFNSILDLNQDNCALVYKKPIMFSKHNSSYGKNCRNIKYMLRGWSHDSLFFLYFMCVNFVVKLFIRIKKITIIVVTMSFWHYYSDYHSLVVSL